MVTKARYIDTLWEIRDYDVWGNKHDGWEVNDTSVIDHEYPIRIRVQVNNAGTPHEFESAYPSDCQIRKALRIKPRVKLDCGGDDIHITVDHATDGYPLGELMCVSHSSLSPIRSQS